MRDAGDFRPAPGPGIQVLGGAQVPGGDDALAERLAPDTPGAGAQTWVKRMTTWGRAVGGDRRGEGRCFGRKEGPAVHATGCNDRRAQNATVAVVMYWRGSV